MATPILNRVNYAGAALFAGNSHGIFQLDRITAFGSSGDITREDAFELGQRGVVDVIEELSEYSATIDGYEYGSHENLLVLSGELNHTATGVNFSSDLESGKSDIINYISAPNGETIYTQVLKDAYLTGYSASFNVDGESTESFTLASDNKAWYLNGPVFAGQMSLEPDNESWIGEVTGATEVKVVSVYADGVSVPFDDNSSGGSISVSGVDGTSVKCTFVCDSESAQGVKKFVPNTSKAAQKRRGHIDVFLVKGHTVGSNGNIIGGTEMKQFRIQSVSVDASLDRENLSELGSTRYYDRPLTLPLNITSSFDLTFSDLNMFAEFAGLGGTDPTEIRPEQLTNDIGMIVKIFQNRDIDPTRGNVTKTVQIPYLIPTDEAFNISLDGNATQTFSFRSHELYIGP